MKKKLVYLVLVVLATSFFTSCNRTWVCECSTGSGVVPIELSKMSKNEAREECEKYSTTQYALTKGCALK